MNMENFIRKILKYQSVTSTFDKLLEFEPENGLTVVAESQTNGVGRLGRQWQSDSGGLYFSFYVDSRAALDKLPFLAIICALAAHRTLSKYVSCYIKWPNDIVSEGKKLCGILTKTAIFKNNASYVMAGIGVNVNNTEFADELKDTATSLKHITDIEHNKDEILEKFFNEFESICSSLSTEQIINQYSDVCITLNSSVALHYTDGTVVEGVCTGICGDGTIDVETEKGKINVNSGEVSVRGIYGYV